MHKNCPICNNALPNDANTCPSCGYRLTETTERFEPVNLSEEIFNTPKKPLHEAALSVIRGSQAGLVFKLGDSVLSIGRSPQCSVFLNDMTVSRQHATIMPTDEGYLITDEHSFNGVWVNNESITSKILQAGDIVQIGSFCLLYQED